MNPAIWSAKSIFKYKNQVDSSMLTWNLVDTKILQSDWPKAFLTLPNQKFTIFRCFFFLIFIYMPQIKFIHFFFLDIADLRILQSDLLRTLWLTTLEREFSQIWDLYRRHKANNTRSGKKTTFWKKLLKSLLSVILHIFGENKYFSWKIGLYF